MLPLLPWISWEEGCIYLRGISEKHHLKSSPIIFLVGEAEPNTMAWKAVLLSYFTTKWDLQDPIWDCTWHHMHFIKGSNIHCSGILCVHRKYWVCMQAQLFQSCPTLCYAMDCGLPASLSMRFSRQEYWSSLSWLPSGDLPDPDIEPESLSLQADSLLLSHWEPHEI